MARKETTATHTPEALELMAAELEEHAAGLRAAIALLHLPEPINTIDVRYENSREVGIEYLRNWVNEVKQVSRDARIHAAQKRGVRPSGAQKPASTKASK